jgi:hypothetical protein
VKSFLYGLFMRASFPQARPRCDRRRPYPVERQAALLGDEVTFERLRRAESVGRPLGDDSFIARLEALTRRTLKLGKRGPKPAQLDEPEPGRFSGLSP